MNPTAESPASGPPGRLHGLVAATHTPFQADGSLNLDVIEAQAAHLARWHIDTVFISGTTGECHSLTLDERRSLTDRWTRTVRGTRMRVVVHVGSNCVADAAALARHAEMCGAVAISALAPSYFKPPSAEALVACCQEIAAAAPATPFYYYDIPSMTGVSIPPPRFLELASTAIPTLAGLKFSNPDLFAFLQCLQADNGRWDVPWGIDEWLVAALATGATAAVGSTYNFAAPVAHQIIAHFSAGDIASARLHQLRLGSLVALLSKYGFMAAAKTTMTFLGIDVGPPRSPLASLSPSTADQLRLELESLGFFEWIAAPIPAPTPGQAAEARDR